MLQNFQQVTWDDLPSASADTTDTPRRRSAQVADVRAITNSERASVRGKFAIILEIAPNDHNVRGAVNSLLERMQYDLQMIDRALDELQRDESFMRFMHKAADPWVLKRKVETKAAQMRYQETRREQERERIVKADCKSNYKPFEWKRISITNRRIIIAQQRGIDDFRTVAEDDPEVL